MAVRWNRQKSFGFISVRGDGADLFCHANDIQDGAELVEGATVRFVRVWDERKQKYFAAEVTGGAPASADHVEPDGGGQREAATNNSQSNGKATDDHGHGGSAALHDNKRQRHT